MDILQSHACTLCHAEQWVFGDVELNAYLVDKTLVEAAEHGAASGEVYTVADDVGVQFGRGLLKGAEYRCLDFGDCLFDAVAYFLIAHGHFEGQGGHKVGAVYNVVFRRVFKLGKGRTHVHLDLFGCAHAYLDVVGAAHG